jgi:hypothetical protein
MASAKLGPKWGRELRDTFGGKKASKECQMSRKKKPSAEAAVRDI